MAGERIERYGHNHLNLVTEIGQVRVRCHKDRITSLNFLTAEGSEENGTSATSVSDNFLPTTSKDALIKV
jgi:hypothetical protein